MTQHSAKKPAGRAIYIGTKLEAGGVDAVLDYAM